MINNLTLKISSTEELSNNLNSFRPLKALELIFENKKDRKVIKWLPLIKELSIERLTLSGNGL